MQAASWGSSEGYVMRNRLPIAIGLMLVITYLPGVYAREDKALKEKVEAYYKKVDQLYGAKDLEGLLSTLADDFQVILAGLDREVVRSYLKTNLAKYDEMRAKYTPIEISQSGKFIRVLRDEKISGKIGNGDWEEISNKVMLEFLVQEKNSLKCSRLTDIDKTRLNTIKGLTYKDEQIDFSFAVPEGWEILPYVHPLMQGSVLALAPDKSSVVLFGYVKAPGLSAQQAAEGDEAIGKALSVPGAYQLFKSGPISIGPYKGFEIESKFFIPSTQERHRRRVYLKSGGLLYVLCFDAIPFHQWDKVKDGFQSIVDSIK
jgi:hypothetical protein